MTAPARAPRRDPAHRPLPCDDTMAALYCLATGRDLFLHPTSGRMGCRLRDGRVIEIEGHELDDLFARGWVAADDETRTLTVTGPGMYWVKRWVSAAGVFRARLST